MVRERPSLLLCPSRKINGFEFSLQLEFRQFYISAPADLNKLIADERRRLEAKAEEKVKSKLTTLEESYQNL